MYNEGSELNSTTAMYDLPFRNYDAALGRFMQVDPLTLTSVDQSPYHYAGGDPVFWNDPMGLQTTDPVPTGRVEPRRFNTDQYANGYFEEGFDNPNSMYFGSGGLVYGAMGYSRQSRFGIWGYWTVLPLNGDDGVGVEAKFVAFEEPPQNDEG